MSDVRSMSRHAAISSVAAGEGSSAAAGNVPGRCCPAAFRLRACSFGAAGFGMAGRDGPCPSPVEAGAYAGADETAQKTEFIGTKRQQLRASSSDSTQPRMVVRLPDGANGRWAAVEVAGRPGRVYAEVTDDSSSSFVHLALRDIDVAVPIRGAWYATAPEARQLPGVRGP